MTEAPARKSVRLRFAVPLLALALLPFALYTAHLCGCAHPMEVLTGMRPLQRTDAELHKRLAHRMGPGRTRAEVDKVIGDTIGGTFDRYCRRSGPSGDLSCRAVLQRDWFGYREQGLSIEVAYDAAGTVSRLEVARFSRMDWD